VSRLKIIPPPRVGGEGSPSDVPCKERDPEWYRDLGMVYQGCGGGAYIASYPVFD